MNGTQELLHIICVFLGSFLANVELFEVSLWWDHKFLCGLEDRYCVCFKSITLSYCLLRQVFTRCNFSGISGNFGAKNFLQIIEPPIQLLL